MLNPTSKTSSLNETMMFYSKIGTKFKDYLEHAIEFDNEFAYRINEHANYLIKIIIPQFLTMSKLFQESIKKLKINRINFTNVSIYLSSFHLCFLGIGER
jgi:hypothetical protein